MTMSGKEVIISKIVLSAEEKSNEILTLAKNESEQLIAKAQKIASDKLEQAENIAKQNEDETIVRRVAVARLDAQKYLLAQKSELLKSVYSSVVHNLRANKENYVKFLTAQIKAHAEQGDQVVISQNDVSIITQSFLNEFDLDLVLSEKVGSFLGGVILSSKAYDKDLTLESIANELRNETEIEVAKILFEENK